jgi:hypothetical protein
MSEYSFSRSFGKSWISHCDRPHSESVVCHQEPVHLAVYNRDIGTVMKLEVRNLEGSIRWLALVWQRLQECSVVLVCHAQDQGKWNFDSEFSRTRLTKYSPHSGATFASLSYPGGGASNSACGTAGECSSAAQPIPSSASTTSQIPAPAVEGGPLLLQEESEAP